MSATETMTLNMPEKEMRALEELAEKRGMSKTAVMRQALRVYQLIVVRQEAGEEIQFSGDVGRRTMVFVP